MVSHHGKPKAGFQIQRRATHTGQLAAAWQEAHGLAVQLLVKTGMPLLLGEIFSISINK